MQQPQNGFSEEAAAEMSGAWSDEAEGISDEMEELDAYEEEGADEALDDDGLSAENAMASAEDALAEEAEAQDTWEDETGEGMDVIDQAEDELADTEDAGDEAAEAIEAGEAWDESANDDDALVQEVFIDTLDAEGDAFWRSALASVLRGAAGVARNLPRSKPWWQLTGQLLSKLPVPCANDIGRAMGRYGTRARIATDPLEGLAQLLNPNSLDHMDLYADAVTDYAAEGDAVDAFAPPLAGMAARYAVRATVSPALRAARKQAVEAIGRATARAVERSTRALLRRYGPQAAHAVPRIVRRVVRTIVQQRASPKAIPVMVQRTTAKVLRSPRAARKLARPSRSVRSVRVRAGIRPGAPIAVKGYAASGVRPYARRGRWRTVTFRGPVTIRFRR